MSMGIHLIWEKQKGKLSRLWEKVMYKWRSRV
jgi:hypothetical protein